MANNRLYLVDTETNEKILLCKSFGSGWYIWHSIDELNEWLEFRDAKIAWGMGDEPTNLKLVHENDSSVHIRYAKAQSYG